MLLDIVIIIIGIYIVLKGADLLTEGAVSLAQRMNMPEMLIGLTVVAVGTSMPEFFVSVTSALQGTTDLAVANVVGSNIFNVLLIAGVSAVVSPMVISRSTVRRDILVAVMASLILLGFGVVQVGLSLKSHDPSQRANGFLTLAGGVIITFAKEILDLIMA